MVERLAKRTGEVVPALLRSAEFAREIEAPLRDDGVPAPLRFEAAPRSDLLAWAADTLPLGETTRARIPALGDWRSLLATVFDDAAFRAFLDRNELSDLRDLGPALSSCAGRAMWRPLRHGTPVVDLSSGRLRFLPVGVDREGDGPEPRPAPAPTPLFDLQALDEPGAFLATGRDPQFLHPLEAPVHRCRVEVTASFADREAEGGPTAQLFVDDGEGFRESHSARMAIVERRLDIRFVIESPRPLVQLRFDPSDRPCRFEISRFRVTLLPGLDGDGISAERLARPPKASPPASAARVPAAVGRTPANVILVNYDRFDNNSGGHIARIANGLAARGHGVSVVAQGDGATAGDFGQPNFAVHGLESLEDALPEPLIAAAGRPGAIVHAWTPREVVRRITQQLRERTGCRYCVHLENNEEEVAARFLDRPWDELARRAASEPDAPYPAALSHPSHYRRFLTEAAGITVIVDSLRAFVPEGVPTHLLEPGVDLGELGAAPDMEERARRRRELFIAPDATVIVYPGNMHLANQREVFSLYTAVTLLRRRGHDVVLVRTGRDFGPGLDLSFDSLRRNGVVPLGHLPRAELMGTLHLADIFVQPGAIDAFNRFRLPAKLPEFLAAGRPVVLPATNLGLRLRDGIEARLLHTGDGLEIARVVEELMADPARMAEIGRAGQAFARTLSWDASVDGLQSFYRTLP